MGRTHKPRSGSLQYWPRKRASRIHPSPNTVKTDKLLTAFAGYKVGMTGVYLKNSNPNAPAKGIIITCPATVIECPPLRVLGLKFYKRHNDALHTFSFIPSQKNDKNIERKISPTKTPQTNTIPNEFDEARLVVYTQPCTTGIGKKKPDIFEIVTNERNPQKLSSYLDSEIKISDIIKPGEYVDVAGVTKGKGLQGVVKRFGVTLKAKKSEKKKRSVGNLGSWTPKRVSWTVAQAGQMGYHTRTESNKYVLLSSNPKERDPTPKGGFKRYGIIKNDYLVIKGSLPGPSKRLLILTPSRRKPKTKDVYEVTAL